MTQSGAAAATPHPQARPTTLSCAHIDMEISERHEHHRRLEAGSAADAVLAPGRSHARSRRWRRTAGGPRPRTAVRADAAAAAGGDHRQSRHRQHHRTDDRPGRFDLHQCLRADLAGAGRPSPPSWLAALRHHHLRRHHHHAGGGTAALQRPGGAVQQHGGVVLLSVFDRHDRAAQRRTADPVRGRDGDAAVRRDGGHAAGGRPFAG